MALASICSDFKKENQLHYSFSGFIVDHGLRSESREEALQVANELRRLDIEPEILKLDWTPYGNPKDLPNFETIARRLRYQAIGKACFQQRISTVLVGHHADDLGETVMSRIVARYLGEGLQGIKWTALIPECEGIYGVDASGIPHSINSSNTHTWKQGRRKSAMPDAMLIESGGVYLNRPLLLFTKAQLIEICQKDNVQWFEDGTNSDKSLTIRNTIRSLQQTGSLPAALQRPRLMDMAKTVRDKYGMYEQRAKAIFDSMSIQLDMRTSTATFSLPENVDFGATASGEPYRVRAVLARKLLMLVSPLHTMSLQDLDSAVESMFSEASDIATKTQIQGVIIQKQSFPGADKGTNITISRTPPDRLSIMTPIKLSALRVSDEPPHEGRRRYWTEWLLWDNRYWIRVGCLSSCDVEAKRLHFFVNFLTPETIHHLRSKSFSPGGAVGARVNAVLRMAGESKKWQPVITMKLDDGDGDGDDDGKSSTGKGNSTEEAIALPALGWTKRTEFVKRMGIECQARYKAVEFGDGKHHKV